MHFLLSKYGVLLSSLTFSLTLMVFAACASEQQPSEVKETKAYSGHPWCGTGYVPQDAQQRPSQKKTKESKSNEKTN